MKVIANKPQRVQGRRGMAVLYIGLIMVVMVGFVSFAVDLGRVQVAKTELRATADSAARAGVSAVFDGPATVESRAVEYAAYNTCLSTSVVVDPAQDLDFGRWNRRARTFTLLSGADRVNANALRVRAQRYRSRGNPVPLVFGALINWRQCDVGGVAAAAVRGGAISYGIVGIDWVRDQGTSLLDSYDSRENGGVYTTATAKQNGDVSSNGEIRLGGTVVVKGIAHPGPDQLDIVEIGHPTVTDVEPLTELLQFPNVDPNPYRTSNNNAAIPAEYIVKGGSFKLGANVTYTLPAGRYYFKDFDIHGTATLIIGGPVDICITGKTTIAGTVNTQIVGNRPGNFKINVAGNGDVKLTGTSDLYADIYAPQADVVFQGTHDFFGGVVGKTLTLGGTPGLHYDESLAHVKMTPLKIYLIE